VNFKEIPSVDLVGSTRSLLGNEGMEKRVPGHAGLHGNKLTNTLAKSGVDLPADEVPCPFALAKVL